MKTCGAEKGIKWDFPFNSDMKPVVVVLTGVDLDATYVISVATVDQQQCGPPQSLSATLQLGGKQLLSPGCWFDSLFFFCMAFACRPHVQVCFPPTVQRPIHFNYSLQIHHRCECLCEWLSVSFCCPVLMKNWPGCNPWPPWPDGPLSSVPDPTSTLKAIIVFPGL